MAKQGAIFLDRDGVICENRDDYVKSWDEFEFIPDVLDALARLSQLPLPIVVVTNQSPIGRGIFTTDVLNGIHTNMRREIEAVGGRIDQIYYCPHHPDAGCDCRKPRPGMLLDAAKQLDLDLTKSYMVGDAASDVQVGVDVGCRPFLVLSGRGQRQLPKAMDYLLETKHTLTIAPSLVEVVEEIYIAEHRNDL